MPFLYFNISSIFFLGVLTRVFYLSFIYNVYYNYKNMIGIKKYLLIMLLNEKLYLQRFKILPIFSTYRKWIALKIWHYSYINIRVIRNKFQKLIVLYIPLFYICKCYIFYNMYMRTCIYVSIKSQLGLNYNCDSLSGQIQNYLCHIFIIY